MISLFELIWSYQVFVFASSQSIECGSTYTVNPQYPTNEYYVVPYVTILSDDLFLVSWSSNGVTKNKYYTTPYTGSIVTALNNEFSHTPYSTRGSSTSFKLHASHKADDIYFSWYAFSYVHGFNNTCYKYDNLLHINGPNNEISLIHKTPYINYNALDPILSGAIGIEWLLSEQTEYTASANYYILKWLKPNNNTIYFAICAFDDFVHSASDVNVYEIANAFNSTVDGLKGISRIVYSQYYFTLLWKSMMDDSPRNHIYGITYSFTGRQETGIMKLHSDKMLNSSMLCGIHTIAARIRHDGKLFLCYEVCGVGTYSKDIVCTLLNQLTLNVDDSDAIEKRLLQNRLISQTTPLIAVYPNDNAVVCYRHNERDLNPAKRDDNIRCLMIDETLNIIVNSQQISFNDWIHNNETDGYFHMQPILYGNPYRFIITWQHAEQFHPHYTYQWVKLMVCSDSSKTSPPSSAPTNNPTKYPTKYPSDDPPTLQSLDPTQSPSITIPSSWVLKESLNCYDGFQDAEVNRYCEPCPAPYVGTVGKCNIKCGWSEEPSDQRDECQLSSGIEALIVVCTVVPVVVACISAFVAKVYGLCCFRKDEQQKDKSYSAIDPTERTEMTNIGETKPQLIS
eukprot:604534_1